MNQLNVLHVGEPNEPPIEWKSQPPAAHFKSSTSTSKTNPVILAIMRRLNHHAIDNGSVKVPTSGSQFESNSETVQDPDTTPIKLN